MIKEALQYIVGLSPANLLKIGEIEYSDKQLHKIEPPSFQGFNTSTLKSIVDYIQREPDNLDDRYIIHIDSPTRVVLTTSEDLPHRNRHQVIVAKADLPSITFGSYMDVEHFIIQMQAKFLQTTDAFDLMRFVGNVKEEAVKSTSDDGISQTVTARAGIVKVEEVVVPNPVTLAPYRTFIEVPQPTSQFVFRMQSGPKMALFEADGGAWRNQAMQNIQMYFEEALAVQIENMDVTIIS